MKQLTLLIFILCERGVILMSADECDQCKPGIAGPPGLQGIPGRPGKIGLPGLPGYDGVPGIKGERGENGVVSRIAANKGFLGEEGPPGVAGLPGFQGDPGDVGPPGEPGELLSPTQLRQIGPFETMAGMKGDHGEDGQPGIRGPPGLPGRVGRRGAHGLGGQNGLTGIPGRDGEKGEKGEPGPMGTPGPTGRGGSRRRRSMNYEADEEVEECNGISTMLVRHSQSEAIPDCNGIGTTKWVGYSYFAIGKVQTPEHNLHVDHLGSSTSCVVKAPDTQDSRRWLSAYASEFKQFPQSISRCAVCEVCSPILVMHSQSPKVPECPGNWQQVWRGYSVIQAGAPQLSTAGSCLQEPLRLVDCPSQCEEYKETVWLSTIPDDQTEFDDSLMTRGRSRCSVCAVSTNH